MQPGQALVVDRIPAEAIARIIETLSPLVRPERRVRIEAVVGTRTRQVVLVLEDIMNEHNASAVLRTAEAFGFFELHVIEREHRFEISNRITRGAQKWLDLRRHHRPAEAYRALKARGYQIWASDIHGEAIDLHQIDIQRKVALVFGNEHAGLSAEAVAAADGTFKIPMAGFVESFNISVAAAVSAYDLLSRRRLAQLPIGLDPADDRGVYAAFLARSVQASAEILERAGLPLPVLSDVVLEDRP